MKEENKSAHPGIENVITRIYYVKNSSGEIDKSKFDLHIQLYNTPYSFYNYNPNGKTETRSDINVTNLIGVLYLTKKDGDKHKVINVTKHDANSRKYASTIVILEAKSEGAASEQFVDIGTLNLDNMSHNPRHRVIDPVGGGD